MQRMCSNNTRITLVTNLWKREKGVYKASVDFVTVFYKITVLASGFAKSYGHTTGQGHKWSSAPRLKDYIQGHRLRIKVKGYKSRSRSNVGRLFQVTLWIIPLYFPGDTVLMQVPVCHVMICCLSYFNFLIDVKSQINKT